MDYDKISAAAQAACASQLKTAKLNKDASEEMQSKVFTSGIIAAIKEYERQKQEN